MRTILFIHGFKRFSGGHLKVWNYFNHVLASAVFEPRIWFPGRTNWEGGNPWEDAREYVIAPEAPIRPDAFFIRGRHWRMLDRYPHRDTSIPIINLVQHVDHADKENRR